MTTLSYPSSCSPLARALFIYEDDGDDAYPKEDGHSFVGEEQPIPRPPPQVKAKRQRGAVGDVESDEGGEGGEGGEGQRQRKRRKTEYTQTTLVNPTQYNTIRDSPLSKAAASKRAPSQDFPPPTRLPGFNFTKSTKRAPVPRIRVMDLTAGRAKRRESVAQQIADQTFALEHEEDGEEDPEVVTHSKEESLRFSDRHQEEDFGEATELQTPKRQRKSRLNPDLIPAVTYQSEITFFHLIQSSLTLWCQRFELASGLGLNPELKPLSVMLMLTHVLRLIRVAESVLDGEAICGTRYIQSNTNNLDHGLLERSNLS